MNDERIELIFDKEDVIKEASFIGKKLTKKQAEEFIGWMVNRCDFEGFYRVLQEYIDCYFEK